MIVRRLVRRRSVWRRLEAEERRESSMVVREAWVGETQFLVNERSCLM
jgi:hypothetical protein